MSDESVSREIAASPETVWAMVSDLPRMGEWSGENVGGTWLKDASGPTVDAKFRGRNRNGIRRWSSNVRVVESSSPERFAFDVSLAGIPIAAWSYVIEPTATGCRVTESWTDRRPGWFRPIATIATGVADRPTHTRAGMKDTLDRVAASAES